MKKNSNRRRTVHLVSLGCPKNLVDSEYLLGLLTERGCRVVEEPDQAEILLVNTCAFIQSAVEESIDHILHLAEYKKTGPARILGVLGCLPQRYGAELIAALPEVDLFCGTGEVDLLPNLLEQARPDQVSKIRKMLRPGFLPDSTMPRLRSAPFYRAYLKIAEGCSNACSYCLIPRLRGPLRSRPLPWLIDEAAALAESGAKELILVAQDTTAYGRDLKDDSNLVRLLRDLAGISGLEWLRVMYAYPSGLTEELIEVLAQEPKVCKYLDLPLQHVRPALLRRMRRDDSPDLLSLVQSLRQAVPGLALRTTMMVGFPGETDADFAGLLDFISEARFEHLGVFKFSPEEGTAAAKALDQVPQRIKENRRRKLMARQRRLAREINRAMIGRTLPVLVEGVSPETDLLLVGRTQGQAPEIDGQVYLTKGRAAPGDIVPVLITHAHDYDLVGEIVDDGTSEEKGFLDRPVGGG